MSQRNEVLWQCFMEGPVWDGDLANKTDRNEAAERGLLFSYNGWNFVTPLGVRECLALGYDREKNARRLNPSAA